MKLKKIKYEKGNKKRVTGYSNEISSLEKISDYINLNESIKIIVTSEDITLYKNGQKIEKKDFIKNITNNIEEYIQLCIDMIEQKENSIFSFSISSYNNELYWFVSNITQAYANLITEELLEKYEEKFFHLLGHNLIKIKQFSIPFIIKNKKKFIPFEIFKYQKLDEKTIKDFINNDKIVGCRCWRYITMKQKLSEKFITKYLYYIPAKELSRYQELSFPFIAKHFKILDIRYMLSYNKYISQTTKKQLKQLMTLKNI